jgi:hypothetical protein
LLPIGSDVRSCPPCPVSRTDALSRAHGGWGPRSDPGADAVGLTVESGQRGQSGAADDPGGASVPPVAELTPSRRETSSGRAPVAPSARGTLAGWICGRRRGCVADPSQCGVVRCRCVQLGKTRTLEAVSRERCVCGHSTVSPWSAQGLWTRRGPARFRHPCSGRRRNGFGIRELATLTRPSNPFRYLIRCRLPVPVLMTLHRMHFEDARCGRTRPGAQITSRNCDI